MRLQAFFLWPDTGYMDTGPVQQLLSVFFNQDQRHHRGNLEVWHEARRTLSFAVVISVRG